MKNKGFTLIELLAVIVILAIIALIATPIILNIINDSRESATKRSAENYLSAVEQAIARKNLTEDFNPSSCEVQSNGNLICEGTELEIDVNGEKPSSGTITFNKGSVSGVTLAYGSKTVTKNSNGNLVISDGANTPSGPVLTNLCKSVTETTVSDSKVPQGNFEYGDEYICDVDGTNSLHFFVLSTEGDNVTLILNENICNDGTLDPEHNCKVAWATYDDYVEAGGTSWNTDMLEDMGIEGSTDKGPVTLLKYLQPLKSVWNNLEDDRISIPTRDQISVASGGIDFENYEYSIPNWLIGGYLTSSAWTYDGNEDDGLDVFGIETSGSLCCEASGTSLSFLGLRPVITVSKSDLS